MSGLKDMAAGSLVGYGILLVGRRWWTRYNRQQRSSFRLHGSPREAHFELTPIDQSAMDEVMGHAELEFLPEEHLWFGTIPGFQGVWSSAPTKEASLRELESVLREWIALSVRQGLPLPTEHGVNLAASING